MDRGRGARSRAHEFWSASVESPHPCALWYTEPPSPRQPRWPREQPRWSREHSARSGAHISCRGAGRFWRVPGLLVAAVWVPPPRHSLRGERPPHRGALPRGPGQHGCREAPATRRQAQVRRAASAGHARGAARQPRRAAKRARAACWLHAPPRARARQFGARWVELFHQVPRVSHDWRRRGRMRRRRSRQPPSRHALLAAAATRAAGPGGRRDAPTRGVS